MNLKESAWKIFSIQRDELRFVLPLFLLYFLSGSFFAVGQIYCESLFLKAYGAKGLSRFFIYNGFILIIAGILYNYFLLRISLKKGFILLISLSSTLILLATLIIEKDYPWLPFFMYMGNYIFTFFIDMHFFNFAFQFLNLRNSKRIIPFLIGGAKLGGILSCLLIYIIFARDISRYGAYMWIINCLLLFIPILLLQFSTTMREGKETLKKSKLLSNARLFNNIIRKIKVAYSSPIFTYTVIAIFIMSIANQVSEYYFAKIFTTNFTTKNQLASFLSIYTFIADFLTLVMELFIISRIIKRIGIQKSNLVYPVSFFSLISMLVIFPNLIIGILIRFWRKNISQIIRTPVYNTIMAASPRDRMAEVKSFISGIINPLGMVLGGGAILLIYKNFSAVQGYIFAIGIGVIFIIVTHLQNMAYRRALQNRLSFDSIGTKDEELCFEDYNELLSHKEWLNKNIEITESLFNRNPSVDMLPQLYTNFSNISTNTKANILKFLGTGKYDYSNRIIYRALKDEEPYIRGMALSLLNNYRYNERKTFLQDSYSNGYISEDYAISILLSLGGRVHNNDIDVDSYCIEKIIEIKNGILEGKLEAIEFIILIQVLSYQYFLGHLVELALKIRDRQFLRSLIPYSNKLQVGKSRRLLYAYKDAPISYLINFSARSESLQEIDKAILLDHREEMSQIELDRLYNYDEKTKNIILNRLFKDLSYPRLSNYLNYILNLNIKPEKSIDRFIDLEIDKILKFYNIIISLKNIDLEKLDKSSPIIRFLIISLEDIIELHKRLILKAIAILTGFNIDEAYEMNFILKDKDLNNYILEYIESSGRQTKKSLFIFDNDYSSIPETQILSIKESFELINDLTMNILPSISNLLRYSLFNYSKTASELGNPYYDNIDSKEEIAMLSLIEKIIFLKENDLFKELKIDELIHIAQITKEIELSKDKVFIKQGEIGDELFIILEGEVEVYTKERSLGKLGYGSWIGELAIIDEEPRSASVKTTKRTRILSIKRRDFLLTLRENPTISINIMQLITQRLRGLL